MKILDRIFNYLLYLTCLIFGVLLIGHISNRAVLTYQSPNWATVSGQVLHSYLTTAGKQSGIFDVNVTYRYELNGVVYTGNTVSYGYRGIPFDENREELEAKAAKYSRGTPVRVFYNPSFPADSCLEAGGNVWGFIFPVFGGVFLIILGAWGLRRLVKQKK
ncbi:MAG TPA: DUF3592 domain-containing protein [Pyrinomonadaceae bacterium]|nr:DUF3592 domain-containing protein [Pyrinomonadaceae bacterium]